MRGEALSFSLRGKATCLQRLTRMTGQEGLFLGLRQLCKGTDTTCVGEAVIARVALHWPVWLSGACVRLPAPWHVSFSGPVRSVLATGQGRCTCPRKGKQAGEGCWGKSSPACGGMRGRSQNRAEQRVCRSFNKTFLCFRTLVHLIYKGSPS